MSTPEFSVNPRLPTMNCLSPLSPLIPAPLATAALQVVPVPIFTATLSIHCRRADNFASERPLQRPEKPKSTGKNACATQGNVLNFRLLTVNCRPSFAGVAQTFALGYP